MKATTIHSIYLNQCLELARESVRNGDHPFGAVIVLDDKVICTALNEVNSMNDITAHAELRLIQKAQALLSKEDLKKCTLYTSTEPCAMCSGAIYWAGINEVIYACPTQKLFDIVKEGLSISSQKIFDNGTEKVNSKNVINSDDFIKIHQSFW